MKKYLVLIVLTLVIIAGFYIFFRFFFTYEQRNRFKRSVESVTGQDLNVTVFDMNGKVIRKWVHVKKITTGGNDRHYTYFYTEDDRYVQIPDSVWYIAEE
jgi:hypothetical protein